MPLYSFRNKETNEETNELLAMSDYDNFLNTNPHLERIFTAVPIISDNAFNLKKTPSAFKDIVKNINKRNPRNNMNF